MIQVGEMAWLNIATRVAEEVFAGRGCLWAGSATPAFVTASEYQATQSIMLYIDH
jgi:hypothetical protein